MDGEKWMQRNECREMDLDIDLERWIQRDGFGEVDLEKWVWRDGFRGGGFGRIRFTGNEVLKENDCEQRG